MAKINLLPWREELRKERQKHFFIALGCTVALAFFILFLGHSSFISSIAHQESRNGFVQTELDTLDLQIKEVNNLKEKKAELLARMEVIQSLQGNRPVMVRVFDEFVRVLPEGLFFEKLSMTGNRIEIEGVSESNNRISKLMRNMDESDWFDEPNLTAVKAREEGKGSTFRLALQQVAPEQKEASK